MAPALNMRLLCGGTEGAAAVGGTGVKSVGAYSLQSLPLIRVASARVEFEPHVIIEQRHFRVPLTELPQS